MSRISLTLIRKSILVYSEALISSDPFILCSVSYIAAALIFITTENV
ncbi:protein of unknown function [Shewanella benthica]|uniref:Uncharacterized protein n=1 Tax=Shewanella benthica TaxID=43661 RepID=A0A330LXK0_9GAMM|nr:protein of unknown function [Shewanella benthica]